MGEVIYRDLDAAARAYFDGDNAPLLRLFAENNLSAGYRQPGGRAAPPDERAAQDRDAIARKEANDPDIYALFTIDEFRKMSIDVSVLDLCVKWPVPSKAHPPQHSIPPGATFPSAPVLVLSGELDALTSPPRGSWRRNCSRTASRC